MMIDERSMKEEELVVQIGFNIILLTYSSTTSLSSAHSVVSTYYIHTRDNSTQHKPGPPSSDVYKQTSLPPPRPSYISFVYIYTACTEYHTDYDVVDGFLGWPVTPGPTIHSLLLCSFGGFCSTRSAVPLSHHAPVHELTPTARPLEVTPHTSRHHTPGQEKIRWQR